MPIKFEIGDVVELKKNHWNHAYWHGFSHKVFHVWQATLDRKSWAWEKTQKTYKQGWSKKIICLSSKKLLFAMKADIID